MTNIRLVTNQSIDHIDTIYLKGHSKPFRIKNMTQTDMDRFLVSREKALCIVDVLKEIHDVEPDQRNSPWPIRSHRTCHPSTDVAEIHRDNGPAWIEHFSGSRREHWYKNGQRHRDDGPAMIQHDYDGVIYDWYIKNERITEKVVTWAKSINLPYWSEWTIDEKILFVMKFG